MYSNLIKGINNTDKNIDKLKDNYNYKEPISKSYFISRINKENNDKKMKYKLNKKPIGKGSFSTVYYALDPDDKEYAIKCIDSTKLDNQKLDKFLLELELSLKLDHQNIVKCYETFKTSTHWYIVDEYCNHGTFCDLLISLKKVDDKNKKEKLAHYYLTQLKNALYYLNHNNIIHRDIKPANILMTRHTIQKNEILVKLADFGFARYFETNDFNTTGYDNMISTICGSPIYMAPELLVDMKYNTKADMWSFGVIMYELLYGVNPFMFPKTIAHLRELMEKKTIKFDEGFSKESLDLMKQLLEFDPIKRINWTDFFNHNWFKLFTENNSPDEIDEIDEKILFNLEENLLFNFDEKINEKTNDKMSDSSKLFNLECQSEPEKLNYLFNEMNNNPFCQDIKSIQIGKKSTELTENKTTKFIETYIDKDKLDDDFVIINDTDEEKINIKTYNETHGSTFIRILSDSFNFILRQAKSY